MATHEILVFWCERERARLAPQLSAVCLSFCLRLTLLVVSYQQRATLATRGAIKCGAVEENTGAHRALSTTEIHFQEKSEQIRRKSQK